MIEDQKSRAELQAVFSRPTSLARPAVSQENRVMDQGREDKL